MKQPKAIANDRWLDLSAAADLLGVHSTTLRRWADDGQVPFYRTPGGRRRFRQSELLVFLESRRVGVDSSLPALMSAASPTIAARFSHGEVGRAPWYGKIDEGQRVEMRNEGRQLMAVLMQYATRSNGGEVFLAEGARMAHHYGQMCRKAGLSLVETVQAFVQVRRSIMDSVYEAGALAGSPDPDTWRLYDRMNNFLDNMLLATLDAYEQAGNLLAE